MRLEDLAHLGALAGREYGRATEIEQKAIEALAAKDAEIEKLKAEIEELKGASK